MAAFVDLITFFGVASFFAWLAYAPLQRDLLKDFEEDSQETFDKARENFYTINDYFLVSFLFYAAAVVLEYFADTAEMPVFGPNPIYGVPLLYFVIDVCFAGGLVTLAAPMWYMRAVGKGAINLGTANLPAFGYTLSVSVIAAADIAFSASAYVPTAPLFQLYSIMMGVITLMGVWYMMKFHDSEKLTRLGNLLLAIPMTTRILMSLVLHI